MARPHVWRTYPRDRVDHDTLRSYGESIQERLDEAADYIEHLEDEMQNLQDLLEGAQAEAKRMGEQNDELCDQVFEWQQRCGKLEAAS